VKITCPCGGDVDVAGDGERDGIGACERCGRYAYFAIIGGRPRPVSPWFGGDTQGPRLPYDDR